MEKLLALIIAYKYFILVPLTIIEGPIATVVAAFLASMSLLNIYAVYFIAVFGDLIGDAMYYGIGRLGRHSIIPRFGKYLGITEERMKIAENHYSNHLNKTIIWGKLTQAPILIILVVAGAVKVDFKRFMWVIFLITLPKVLVFTVVGYYFGQSYQLINTYLNSSILAAWTVIIPSAFLYWVYIRYYKPKEII